MHIAKAMVTHAGVVVWRRCSMWILYLIFESVETICQLFDVPITRLATGSMALNQVTIRTLC
jgi:hypothetical protein